MKNRSILAVVLLPFVTLGIYTLYWFVSTKRELVAKGADIPTSWLLIVPIANIYWLWKYFQGAEKVTNEKVNGVLLFIIDLFVTSIVASAVAQNEYNKLGEAVEVSPAAPQPQENRDEPVVPPTQNIA